MHTQLIQTHSCVRPEHVWMSLERIFMFIGFKSPARTLYSTCTNCTLLHVHKALQGQEVDSHLPSFTGYMTNKRRLQHKLQKYTPTYQFCPEKNTYHIFISVIWGRPDWMRMLLAFSPSNGDRVWELTTGPSPLMSAVHAKLRICSLWKWFIWVFRTKRD